jgi:parallel beta-helix repeat protein
LTNSVVKYNGEHGISIQQNSRTVIKNCWIHNNGVYYGGSGIYFDRSVEDPFVRNNTIYDNYTYGIECTQTGADPNIINCIISGNDTNDLYRQNGSFNKVNYCLLQHPHSGIGNITGSPGFMNVAANPNDLHIGETSQCKNTGDPNANYGDESDIDGEPRIAYGRVDLGGDEYYWSKADYNKDEIVNFIDFSILAKVWRTQDPNITLDADSDVDIDDLKLFCDDWLWKAAWGENQWMKMAGGGGQGDSIGTTGEALAAEITAQNVTNPSKTSDRLMLPDARASLLARPARLRARTDKFYEISPSGTISAMRVAQQLRKAKSKECPRREEIIEAEQPVETEALMVERLVNWLDDVWLTSDLSDVMTEQEYLAFRQSIAESVEAE